MPNHSRRLFRTNRLLKIEINLMSLVTSRITTLLPAAATRPLQTFMGRTSLSTLAHSREIQMKGFLKALSYGTGLNGPTPCSGIQQFNNLISETRKVRGTRSSLQKDYANSTKPAKSALFAPPYEFRYINMDRSSSKGTLSFALLNLKVSKTKRLGYFVSSNLAPEEARLLL